MSSVWYSLNRGQFDGETDNVAVTTVSIPTADIVVQVTTSGDDPTKLDVVKALKIIGQYAALIDTNLPVY